MWNSSLCFSPGSQRSCPVFLCNSSVLHVFHRIGLCSLTHRKDSRKPLWGLLEVFFYEAFSFPEFCPATSATSAWALHSISLPQLGLWALWVPLPTPAARKLPPSRKLEFSYCSPHLFPFFERSQTYGTVV